MDYLYGKFGDCIVRTNKHTDADERLTPATFTVSVSKYAEDE